MYLVHSLGFVNLMEKCESVCIFSIFVNQVNEGAGVFEWVFVLFVSYAGNFRD